MSDRAHPNKKRKPPRLLETECHIGIVGSGLAGLSAALALLNGDGGGVGGSRRGCGARGARRGRAHGEDAPRPPSPRSSPPSTAFRGRITIYERDARRGDRKEGYGMTLTYDPAGPLAQLGVLEAVAKRDCPSRCHYLFNEWGDVEGYFGNAFYDDGEHSEVRGGRRATKGAGQRGNLRIPRSELRSILFDALQSRAASGEIDGEASADDGSAPTDRVRILWKKRLTSYTDGPMEEKLRQIHAPGKERRRRRVPDDSMQGAGEGERPVTLYFDDGTTDRVDLLIGADGVNSVVAQQYLSTTADAPASTETSRGEDGQVLGHAGPSPKPPITTGGETTKPQSPGASPVRGEGTAPQPLGIFIILGISNHAHPLIDERGFYTLDGTRRMFVMPFQGSRLDDDNGDWNRRTMWQLSFPVSDAREAARLRALPPEELRAHVLRQCRHWHAPVPSLVRDTPPGTVWGTSLVDRDPQELLDRRAALEVHGRLPSRVVLVGDAAHPMTPFKGQGANQALADGPRLARWLGRAGAAAAARGYEADTARRSGPRVRASREAAARLHSSECWDWLRGQGRDGGGRRPPRAAARRGPRRRGRPCFTAWNGGTRMRCCAP